MMYFVCSTITGAAPDAASCLDKRTLRNLSVGYLGRSEIATTAH
jgi:hypothetical protein